MYANQGYLPGSGIRDEVNTSLTKGEFVINRNAVSRLGRRNLERINRGYQDGGAVGETGVTRSNSASGNEELIRALMTFNGNAEKLSNALNNFPREISVVSQQRVEVVLNGAEVLKNIESSVKRIALETTREQIDEMMKQNFPETGGLL